MYAVFVIIPINDYYEEVMFSRQLQKWAALRSG